MPMDSLIMFFILIFGVFAGGLGAMLGLGGGVLMVIFLILALNVPPHQAVALSLLAVIASSSMGGSVYVKDKMTNVRLAMVLETCTVTGAVLGAYLALILPILFTEMVLAIAILVSALLMLKSPKSETILAPTTGKITLSGHFFDSRKKATVSYSPTRLKSGLLISLIAGSISGIAGIGGGIIKVPIMNILMKIPVKAAAATSNFMVGVTAAASVFVYISAGYVDLYAAVPTVLGIMVGAYIGTKILVRVESITVKRMLGAVLLFFAAVLLLKAGGIISW
jgi:uncharacterized membrane protein YfcA